MRSLHRGSGGPWLALCLMLAGGCASVQEDAARDVATRAAAAPKPSVQLVLGDDVSTALDDVAEQATRDSGLFGAITAEPKPAAPSDMTIKLGLNSQRRAVSDTETIWEITTVMLFTVYPSTCARDAYELTADVFDRSGRRLKSYDLRDSDTSMLWLFHGKNCGSAPTADKVRHVAKGLLQTLYRDIDGDRLPAIANTGQAAVEAGPQVYVEADRAADIVRHLALVSPCSATTFLLKARLTDRTGKEIRVYRLSDSYRSTFAFDGRGGCTSVDEANHPDDVAEFVGRLFAQMQRDRIFSSEADGEPEGDKSVYKR